MSRKTVVLASLVAVAIWTTIIALRLLAVSGFYDAPRRGDGRTVASYGFDLSNLRVASESIIPGGFARDTVRALVDPPAVAADVALKLQAGHGPLLKPGVRAIGVEVNGQARAYPLLIVQLHEVINDTLGGVPIAVTYSPLCDSAVVFDRRVDGQVLEFGVSGLLRNSNTLMFDRRERAQDESLWSQLGFTAVAGPAAGQTLALLPMRMVTLDHWLVRYPATTISIGDYDDRRMRDRYRGNPYSLYYSQKEIAFPVSPRATDTPGQWPEAFDKIAARRVEDGSWRVSPHAFGDDLAEPVEAQALWFAWYAMHPDSVLGGGTEAAPAATQPVVGPL